MLQYHLLQMWRFTYLCAVPGELLCRGRLPVVTPQKCCVRLLVRPTIDAPLLPLLLYKPLPCHLHNASSAMYRSV
jgi:hypothetical protein